MASSVSFLAMRMIVLLLLSLFHLRACYYASPSMQPLCPDDESYALLQFKESLAIDESACSDPSAYPKIASWKVEGESADCCSWDGVECDKDSGHVIGLDLGSSCLYGSIDSNSSLFHLVQLRSPNLADNNFNNSKIPYGIRNLSRLFDLDLSNSGFSGQIPTEILELSKLVSLDLGLNSLKLQNPGLQNLVEALTNLKVLHLTGVDISTEIPQTMANLSSLSSLFLRECGLHGEFPTGILQLPNLRFLSISGYLPEFQWGSRLEMLKLAGTNFSGQLPESIGNIKSLKIFDAGDCYFSGLIPSSLGNLTKLNYLDLSYNSFSGQIPPLVNLLQISHLSLASNNFTSSTLDWLGNLTKLNVVDMALTNSYGNIPSSLENCTQLTVLMLFENNLTGQIPSWIGNHTQLMWLRLGYNKLHGLIPESIFMLPNLEILYLNHNLFSGTLKIDVLFKPRNLFALQLSSNILSLLNNHNDSIIMPKFKILGLNGCNLLGYFPSFLRSQNHLEFLSLGSNKIEGHIPKWFMNLGTRTLWYLCLAGNLITGFEQSLDVLPWNNLHTLDLRSDKLQGSLPIPPPSIVSYLVSNNQLTGEIPPMICNLTSLVTLQLSNNNLNGKLPQCLGNVSNSAAVLDLRNNSFSGDIPEAFSSGCSLRVIDFSQNKLKGKIPRSLANCTDLEILNIEQNMVNDVFPSWLGILPKLRVLILRSNGFYGVIGKPKTNIEFPKLQIVDLSNNSFWGKLPLEYFRTWAAMKIVLKEHLTYMNADTSFAASETTIVVPYDYSMTMTNKGVMTLYEKIQDSLTAIDLSSNRFEGGIPDVLGDLKELYLLNLSNNLLTGHIPPSLGNLKELEALDLSQNKLSGEIPVQLAQLTFLAVFNVSQNFLSGAIPRGNQFDTFDSTSFDANPGLCGKPLSRDCGNGENSPPAAPKAVEGSGSPFEFGWKVVVIGYASGWVIGAISGCIVNTRKYEWLVKSYFVRWKRKAPSVRTRLPRS